MVRRIDTSSYTTFGEINHRLEDIVTQVRRKDVPLESSLDLFDEAIALGSKAVDFIDTAEVLPEEALDAHEPREDANAAEAQGS